MKYLKRLISRYICSRKGHQPKRYYIPKNARSYKIETICKRCQKFLY